MIVPPETSLRNIDAFHNIGILAIAGLENLFQRQLSWMVTTAEHQTKIICTTHEHLAQMQDILTRALSDAAAEEIVPTGTSYPRRTDRLAK